MLPHQLRSHVRWCSTEDLQLLRIGAKSRKAKVNDLNHVGFILYQNIVKLHITVRNSSGVQEIKSFSDLPEEFSAYRFFNLSVCTLLFHILVQRDPLNIIRHDANLLGSFYQIMHLYDMWVVNLFQSHYLTLHSFSFHGIVQLRLLVDFYCVFPHVDFVVAHMYDGVCPLADGFAYLVVFHDASRDG
jgi:hypothetical protein